LRKLSVLFQILLIAAFMGCSNPSTTTEEKKTDSLADTSQTVTVLAISGVVAPVSDAVPSTTAISATQYTGTVSWAPADNPFKAGTTYTATITLAAKTGFKFAGVAANSLTVSGATTVTNAVDSGVVTAVFPATAAAVSAAAKLVPAYWNGNWGKGGVLKIVVKNGAIYAANGTTEIFPGNLAATCHSQDNRRFVSSVHHECYLEWNNAH